MKKSYFDWMVGKVAHGKQKREYSRLFNILNSYPFEYTHPMDENRECDGEDLRYLFSYECDVPQPEVAYWIDHGACSVLEMLIAMAIRMDGMMYDEDPGLWFWDMMDSLDLTQFTNHTMDKDPYAEEVIDNIIKRFLERDFDPNTGEGSPFTLRDNRGEDLRKVEFWCLAMWHTTEVDGVV